MALLIAFILFAVAVMLFITFIVKRDHGKREPKGALWAAAGYGALAVLAAGTLNAFLVPNISEVVGGTTVLPVGELMVASLTIGLIEETLKCIPLAIFLYKKKYFDELTDGIIYFGIAALTFGIIEDIFYALEYGGGTGILRVVLMPYLHAGFTILFGIMLAYRKVLGKSLWYVVAGYAAAVLMHAAYDFFAFSGGYYVILMLALTAVLNVSLFVIFRWAQRKDESRGMSAIGINKFCRNCGAANPERLLYCSQCGKLS
jgi:protease PrsW